MLEGLPSADIVQMPVNSGETVSILGLSWYPGPDILTFQASSPPVTGTVSKRVILSHIAKLFDPLEFLAPVLIKAKILLQDLWLHKLDWDTSLSDDLLDHWLISTKLSRWLLRSNYQDGPDIRQASFGIYTASPMRRSAFSAAVCAVNPGTQSTLLMAKTQVAPTKVETLPRLELCRAVLLSRLATHVLTDFPFEPNSINFWTDSRIVLDWLKAHPSCWPTFIANRTNEILSAFPTASWRHVRSTENPADCASRGTSPRELAHSSLWWKGPPWIIHEEHQGPQSLGNGSPIAADAQLSLEENVYLHVHAHDAPNDECLPTLQKFSNFFKVLRILAYVYRWRINSKLEPEQRCLGPISAQEWKAARVLLFRAAQAHHFAKELRNCKLNQPLSPSSTLSRFSPFLCSRGLLRVRGNLQNAPVPYNEKHPIILPGCSIFVKRLVEEAHILTLHGGIQLMTSHLYRSYDY